MDEIKLTLTPGEVNTPQPTVPMMVQPIKLEETRLTEKEQKQVDEFSEKIDIGSAGVIMQYGSEAQQKMSTFSEATLQSVRTKDLGEVGDMVADLVVELKGFDVDDNDNGFFAWLKRGGNKIASLKARYDKAEVNVDKVSAVLEGHEVKLMKDVAMLDELYHQNLTYFKELTMYILAGKKKLTKERATTLVEMRNKAQTSGLAEDAQAANDYANLCERFEKKLYDLELTRMISIQMSPQIRLIQNNDVLMSEKIQSTLVNTIPLWKSQMVLALGLAHSEEAMKAQREVTNMTNELLRKNAAKLKQGTIDIARESERGIVEVETLQETNKLLIETLDEVLAIQKEGALKRRAAEQELAVIEGQIKQKLLEIRT
jgi:uncharacterized protein YaaN involved in tellurite resistance